ncbi:hypothetical protein ACFWQC_03100 [Nocardioides sp. NPDC058538]|uniref:hypothetical protein n=1 Tax=Nocardioides sp. NPDC058538 TaxID=3346542 RepID=UPI0036519004
MSLDFTTSSGLRMLLTELHYAGEGAWRQDPDAAALLEYAADKYASLAHKHGLTPQDAAYAAFTVLRTDAVRAAYDPWAATTRAVQISLIYEERANGLLCSNQSARRREVSTHHDAERFGDHEISVLDYHPAFQVPAEVDQRDEPAMDTREPIITTDEAFEMTTQLFTALGWPMHVTQHAISYVSSRLMDSGNRVTAHETLRKDLPALQILDLPQPTWSTLLTTVLGNPHPDYEHTSYGHGIWWRLLLGETLTNLLAEDDLVRAITATTPSVDSYDRVERVLAHVA